MPQGKLPWYMWVCAWVIRVSPLNSSWGESVKIFIWKCCGLVLSGRPHCIPHSLLLYTDLSRSSKANLEYRFFSSYPCPLYFRPFWPPHPSSKLNYHLQRDVSMSRFLDSNLSQFLASPFSVAFQTPSSDCHQNLKGNPQGCSTCYSVKQTSFSGWVAQFWNELGKGKTGREDETGE